MLDSHDALNADIFWEWFQQNHLAFEFLGNMEEEQREDLMIGLESYLDAYSGDNLVLRPSANLVTSEDRKFQLVISAVGDVRYFGKAKELAAVAPDIPNWKIIALQPPLPEGVEIRFDTKSGHLYPKDLWIHLMDSPGQPNFLGLRIALKQYDFCADEHALQELRQIVIQMVAYIIGEESWGVDVQYLELAPLPSDPMEEEMFQIDDLAGHIANYRKEFPSLKWEELAALADEEEE